MKGRKVPPKVDLSLPLDALLIMGLIFSLGLVRSHLVPFSLGVVHTASGLPARPAGDPATGHRHWASTPFPPVIGGAILNMAEALAKFLGAVETLPVWG